MDFHGVWDDQTGLNPRPLTPPEGGVGGGRSVCHSRKPLFGTVMAQLTVP